MNDKKARDALAVERYKAAAALRRAERLMIKQQSELGMTAKKAAVRETVVVRFAKDAKPLSALGGVVNALGPSHICIPEYKLERD